MFSRPVLMTVRLDHIIHFPDPRDYCQKEYEPTRSVGFSRSLAVVPRNSKPQHTAAGEFPNHTQTQRHRAGESKLLEPNQALLPGDNGGGDPPVPIPNTEVKPSCADGTAHEVGE